MLFGQQNNTKQPRAKQTAQVGGQHTGQKIVTGVVRDDNGDPLIGVNVQAVGTQTGVITDVNGKYSIQVSAGRKTVFFLYWIPDTDTVCRYGFGAQRKNVRRRSILGRSSSHRLWSSD